MKRLTAALIVLVLCSRVDAQPIPGFGPPDDKKPIVGFGLEAEIMLTIEAAHWAHTIGYMKRVDRDRSGYLERDEVKHFSDGLFRKSDINGDGRLSFHEKALEDLDFHRQTTAGRRRRTEIRIIDGQEVTAADRQQAASTVKKYDKNENGIIDASEIPGDWRTQSLHLTDRNGDGRVTLREMERRWTEYRTERARRPQWWTELAPEARHSALALQWFKE